MLDLDFVCKINFSNPYRVLKEAERLVKEKGVLIAFLQNTPLLEDSFKLNFSERKEYYLKSGVGIIIKEEWEEQEKNEKKEKQQDNFINLVKEADKLLEDSVQPKQIRNFLKRIDIEINKAITEYRVKQKIELIQVKEKLLNKIVMKKEE